MKRVRTVALIVMICAFIGGSASADWADVAIENSDFEDAGGSLTGWLTDDMVVGTGGGPGNHYARFNNGAAGNPGDGQIRQFVELPVGTTTLKLGFRFTGVFSDPVEYDSLFSAMIHVDDDGLGNVFDMYHLMWSEDTTTPGWVDVETYWTMPSAAGSLSPNARIKFLWENDHRLYSSGIDDITLQAVPVPGAFLLAGIGLGCTCTTLLRRRKKA